MSDDLINWLLMGTQVPDFDLRLRAYDEIMSERGLVRVKDAEITRLREQLAEARESAEAAWEQWDELQDLLGASKEVGFAFDEVVQLRKQLAEAERQRDAARAVIRRVHDTLWEINPDNYTHDEIVVANNASVEAIFLLADVLGETHGYTPEWWENRRAMIKKGRT